MRDLFFSIRAKDMTGAAFDKVKRGLSAIDGAVAGVGERAGRMGDKLVAVGGLMAGLTGGIALAFGGSLAAWDAQEQALAQLEKAVRRTGAAAGFTADELATHAGKLAAVTRFGDTDIMGQATASLLTFSKVQGDVFLRAQESVADMATVLGTDLQGLAMTLGEALNDPAEGLSALGEAGIVFSEGQTKLVESLVKSGDIAAAQGVILDEVARRFGGAAQAAAEAGIGPLIQFGNVWTDLKETVGGVVAELLPPITGFLTTLAEGFQSLPEPVQRGAVAFVGAGVALGGLALAAGAAMLALAPLSMPFILISGAIAGAIAMCVAFWPELQNVGRVAREVFLGLQVTVANAMQTAVESVVGGANAFVNAFQGAFAAIKAIWSALPAAIGDLVFSAANAMIGGVEAMINGVGGRINAFIGGINKALAALPEWATGEGGLQIGLVGEVSLGRLKNDYEGAARAAAQDAAGAFTAAFEQSPFTVPDLGFKAWADRAQADLDAVRAIPPVLDETAEAADGVTAALIPAADAADGLGKSGSKAGKGLKDAAKGASHVGDELDLLLDKLLSAEFAFDDFGRETSDMLKDLFAQGKLDFESFGSFILSWGTKFLDRVLAQVFDPLGDALQGVFDRMPGGRGAPLGGGGGWFGGGGGLGGILGGIGNFFSGLMGFDTGGEMAVAGRAGIDRNVAAFRVSQGETIKVTRRGEGGGGSPVNVYIQTPNPEAFRASKGRVATDIARAVGHANRFI